MTEQKEKLPWDRRVAKALVRFAAWTVPYLYLAYFRFVWLTSRIIDRTAPLDEALASPPYKAVASVWHQDVFCVAWAYRRFRPHTIASVGDSGEVITRILKLCNFTVFRGGSSKRKSRRKKVLEDFTRHLTTLDGGLVGITVDGSSGPPYRMKSGVVVMAMKFGAPMFLVRIWCKRRVLLKTWDRMMVPLPFNKIAILVDGPHFPPDGMDRPEVFERFHRHVEDRLLALTRQSFLLLDETVDEELMSRFPDGWTPSPEERGPP